MKLPMAEYEEQKSKKFIIDFKGYHNSPIPDDGEYVSGKNISSDLAPCLSPRGPRTGYRALISGTALGSSKKLYCVDGTSFIYDDLPKGQVAAGEKIFLNYNDYILIWPDKKYYDEVNGTFGDIENTYVGSVTFQTNKIVTTGADFTGFNVGDGVIISGCTINTGNNKTAIIRAVAAKELTFSDNNFIVGAEANVTIKRAVPDIDFLAEHENRVWGIKGNNIYASKLGDFKNWNVFDGLSTDSYATSTGSGGDFTGIISTSTHLVFSKEKCIHTLYGSKPSNFELGKAITCSGIQKGCHKSVAVIDGAVYYKGVPGIMRYTGGIPECVSTKFGTKKYTVAVAGTDGQKYYVSLFDQGMTPLFVLDTWQGERWDIEDNFYATDFTFYDGYLHALNKLDGVIYRFNYGNEVVEFEANTGIIFETIKEKQGNSVITVLADLEAGSSLSVYLRMDNGNFDLVDTFTATGLQPFISYVKPERAHHFQIRLVGRGKQKIYALEREFFYGSEV